MIEPPAAVITCWVMFWLLDFSQKLAPATVSGQECVPQNPFVRQMPTAPAVAVGVLLGPAVLVGVRVAVAVTVRVAVAVAVRVAVDVAVRVAVLVCVLVAVAVAVSAAVRVAVAVFVAVFVAVAVLVAVGVAVGMLVRVGVLDGVFVGVGRNWPLSMSPVVFTTSRAARPLLQVSMGGQSRSITHGRSVSLHVPVTANPSAVSPKEAAPSSTRKTMIAVMLGRKKPSTAAPCEAGLPTRDINVSSSVTFWPGTSPPKSLHVPPGQSGFTATPLAGSHNVPVPPTHMAPADVTTGGPAGLGNTMVLTLVRCALPMTRDTMVSAAAGTNVTPAPVAVVIGLIGSVPPPLNATVRMPPGRVSRPSPLLACGSKTPSTGLPMFSMVFEVNP